MRRGRGRAKRGRRPLKRIQRGKPTTCNDKSAWQRLGRTLEVPGLGACKKLADNRGPCCQPTLCSWAGAWQRLGRSLEVPGLGRAGRMLRVSGWRFWEDLVRCWPNVFNLGALPVPCQDRFFLELKYSVFEVFPSKTVLSLEFQPLLTLRFAKVTCAKPWCF